MTDKFLKDVVAGIAQSEKIASDGITSIAVFRRGQFDMLLSGSVTAGDTVVTHSSSGGSNVVAKAAVTASGSDTLGTALEDGSEGETILVELNPGVMGNF